MLHFGKKMISTDKDLQDTESTEFHKDMVNNLKKFARRRNIRAIFCLILFYEFFILVVIAVFSYVEIQVYRFNEALLFAVLWSTILTVFMLLFLGFHLIVYFLAKEDYPFIYDHRLVRNIQAQLTMNWGLPMLSLFIIMIRWLYYTKTGSVVDFHTVDGFLYGNMSFLCFIIAVCGILIVVGNAASFNCVFVTPAEKQVFEKEKFLPNPYFEFQELETDTGQKFYSINMK